MSKAHPMVNAIKSGTVASFGLAALVCFGAAAADTSAESKAETYTWSAELVELDEANSTATVKARVVGEEEQVQLDSLEAGDRAMLTWSGITFGSGIRALEEGAESSFDRMTMPVEFVAAEDNGTYVVFKVQVPDVSRLAELEAGHWVTATSPHQASSESEAVLSMRPYGDVE